MADLMDAIDGLQDENPHLWSDSEVGTRLVALRKAVNRLEAESARTLEAFDRTNAYEVDGSLSAASWLRHRCNLSYNTAAHQVQMARRLPELPQARAAFASGEISLAHVSLMSRTVEQIGIEPVQEQEQVLVEAARQLDPRMFRQVTVHLRHCVDPDGALKEANQAHGRRAVWLSETMDGVFVLNGTLDAEGGAILRTALALSLVSFAASLGLLVGTPVETNLFWIPEANIHFHLAADGLSIWLVLLSTFLTPLAVLISWKHVDTRQKMYYALLLLLEFGLVGVFLSMDLFLFFVFWEVSLVPMYFLIGIWGHGRRIYAAVKFFLYTMAGSALMLVGIIYIYTRTQTFDYPTILQLIDSGRFAGNNRNTEFFQRVNLVLARLPAIKDRYTRP